MPTGGVPLAGVVALVASGVSLVVAGVVALVAGVVAGESVVAPLWGDS